MKMIRNLVPSIIIEDYHAFLLSYDLTHSIHLPLPRKPLPLHISTSREERLREKEGRVRRHFFKGTVWPDWNGLIVVSLNTE
jgi:hypothetical protein